MTPLLLAAAVLAVASPARVPLPYVTCGYTRAGLVVRDSLHADFQPEAFRHEARWNDGASRIEMHLAAERPQVAVVKDLDMLVGLEAGETIWTESCHKFTRASAEAMLARADLALAEWHTDGGYALAVAAAR